MTSFNNWTNVDTWKAWVILSNDEGIYRQVVDDPSAENIECRLFEASESYDIETIMFHKINWSELVEQFKRGES
jgi:hypothetical protein